MSAGNANQRRPRYAAITAVKNGITTKYPIDARHTLFIVVTGRNGVRRSR